MERDMIGLGSVADLQRAREHWVGRSVRVLLLIVVVAVPIATGPAWRNILPSMACLLAGLAIRMWCNGTLHKSKEVTQVGPYSLIRHPMYAGTLLMAAGFLMMLDISWPLRGGVFAFLVLVHIFRATREEKKLTQKFGDAYGEYKSRVPMAVPLLSIFRALKAGSLGAGFSWRTLRHNGEVNRLGIILVFLVGFGIYQRKAMQFTQVEMIGVASLMGIALLFFVFAMVKVRSAN